MTNETSTKNLDTMRVQIELLKKRLDNIEQVLNIQEKIIDMLNENTKILYKDTFAYSKQTNPVEQIMKNAFPSKELPKILFK